MKPNINNRTIYKFDNLDVLRGINSNTIDLVYIDPPFNTRRSFTASYFASSKDIAGKECFVDTFTQQDIKTSWLYDISKQCPLLLRFLYSLQQLYEVSKDCPYYYIAYMAIRLLEIHRILKPTGSLYLHCDPNTNHYLKLVLDFIFGKENFRNEIVWCYKSGGTSKKSWAKKHDIILFYSKTKEYTFNVSKVKSYSTKGGGANRIDWKYDEGGKYNIINERDWWDISILATSGNERTGYPTQKPITLLEKIIKASSNEGDLVLDCFCGSGTTLVASEKLSRQWVGIDNSTEAMNVLKSRLNTEIVLPSIHTFYGEIPINFETKLPQRDLEC